MKSPRLAQGNLIPYKGEEEELPPFDYRHSVSKAEPELTPWEGQTTPCSAGSKYLA